MFLCAPRPSMIRDLRSIECTWRPIKEFLGLERTFNTLSTSLIFCTWRNRRSRRKGICLRSQRTSQCQVALDSRCNGHKLSFPSILPSCLLPSLLFPFPIFSYPSSIVLSIHLATRSQFSFVTPLLASQTLWFRLSWSFLGVCRNDQTLQAWPIRGLHLHNHNDARK